jgi:uncharacterized protein (DUF2267 family)
MTDEDFVKTVEQVAGIPRPQAVQAACATFRVLARCITKGEAEDLAPRLPEELRSCITHTGPREHIHLDEFLQRIQEDLGVGRPAAERIARGAFAALWRVAGGKEFADVRAQLPGDFQPLLDEAIVTALVPPFEDELPPSKVSLKDFLGRVVRRGVDPERAPQAAERVLQVLAMRITGGQVEDLMPLVPSELRHALRRGMERSHGLGARMSLKEFIDEIARLEHVSRYQATQHARAVLAALREVVGDKEFADTVAQLPQEYRETLLQDRASR